MPGYLHRRPAEFQKPPYAAVVVAELEKMVYLKRKAGGLVPATATAATVAPDFGRALANANKTGRCVELSPPSM